MVRDRKLHPSFRLDAVIALARPGNVKARDTLTAIVLDREYEREYRREVLYRLPRLRLPLLESLRDLLYIPFHMTDIRTRAHPGDRGAARGAHPRSSRR